MRLLTFAYGAALSGNFHWVQAALSAGCGHAVRLAVDTLAESAVVFSPAVAVRADLSISVTAGRIVDRVNRICRGGNGKR